MEEITFKSVMSAHIASEFSEFYYELSKLQRIDETLAPIYYDMKVALTHMEFYDVVYFLFVLDALVGQAEEEELYDYLLSTLLLMRFSRTSVWMQTNGEQSIAEFILSDVLDHRILYRQKVLNDKADESPINRLPSQVQKFENRLKTKTDFIVLIVELQRKILHRLVQFYAFDEEAGGFMDRMEVLVEEHIIAAEVEDVMGIDEVKRLSEMRRAELNDAMGPSRDGSPPPQD